MTIATKQAQKDIRKNLKWFESRITVTLIEKHIWGEVTETPLRFRLRDYNRLYLIETDAVFILDTVHLAEVVRGVRSVFYSVTSPEPYPMHSNVAAGAEAFVRQTEGACIIKVSRKESTGWSWMSWKEIKNEFRWHR